MLRDDSERTLATILITNNFINVTIIMLCNYVFGVILHFGPMAYWLEFLCITVLLTFLLLLYGEIIPKVYCRQNPLKFCRRAVGGILFARKLFWPLENLLLRSEFLAEKVVQKENHHLSVDDLEQALELTDKDEIKDEQGTDLYNPCAPGTRFGVTHDKLADTLPPFIEGFHCHCHCESGSDVFERTLVHIEEKFSKWFPQLKWINFGGGHLMTRKDYDVPLYYCWVHRLECLWPLSKSCLFPRRRA